jgi:hypothetical protein
MQNYICGMTNRSAEERHCRSAIHDIKPTKCTKMVLRYLYYNITLNIPTCFDPQRTIIRELKIPCGPKHAATFSFQVRHPRYVPLV